MYACKIVYSVPLWCRDAKVCTCIYIFEFSTCSLESSALWVQWYSKLNRVVLFTWQNFASECDITFKRYCIICKACHGALKVGHNIFVLIFLLSLTKVISQVTAWSQPNKLSCCALLFKTFFVICIWIMCILHYCSSVLTEAIKFFTAWVELLYTMVMQIIVTTLLMWNKSALNLKLSI